MADNNSTVPPDLASILATLSQFAPPVQANDNHRNVIHANDVSNLAPPSDPKTAIQKKSPQPQQPVIDTALITDWSTGTTLRDKDCCPEFAFSRDHQPGLYYWRCPRMTFS